jgi:hypothetical protein
VANDLNSKFIKWMSNAVETLTKRDEILYKALMADLKSLEKTLKKQAKWYAKYDLIDVGNVLWAPSLTIGINAHFDNMRANVKKLDATLRKGFLDPPSVDGPSALTYIDIKALASNTKEFQEKLKNEVCANMRSWIDALTNNGETLNTELNSMKEKLSKPNKAVARAKLFACPCTSLEEAMECMGLINKLKRQKEKTDEQKAAEARRADKRNKDKEAKQKVQTAKQKAAQRKNLLNNGTEEEKNQEIDRLQKEIQEQETKVAEQEATNAQRREHINEFLKTVTDPKYIVSAFARRDPIRISPAGNITPAALTRAFRNLLKDVPDLSESETNYIVKRMRLFDRVLTYYLFSFDGRYPSTDVLLTKFVEQALEQVAASSEFNYNGVIAKTPDFTNISDSVRADLKTDLRNGLAMYRDRKTQNDARVRDFVIFANSPESKRFRISQAKGSTFDALKNEFWKAEQARDPTLKSATDPQKQAYMAPITMNIGLARRLQLFDRVIDYYVQQADGIQDDELDEFVEDALEAVGNGAEVVTIKNGKSRVVKTSDFTDITPSERDHLTTDLLESLPKYKVSRENEAKVVEEELVEEELEEPTSKEDAIVAKINEAFTGRFVKDNADALKVSDSDSDDAVLRTLYKFLLANSSIDEVDDWAVQNKETWFGIKPTLNFQTKKERTTRKDKIIAKLKPKLIEYLAAQTRVVAGGREFPTYDELLEWLVMQLANRIDRQDMLPVVHDMMDNPSITSLKFLFAPESRLRAERDLQKLDAVLRVDPNPAVLSKLLGVVGTSDFARTMKGMSRE